MDGIRCILIKSFLNFITIFPFIHINYCTNVYRTLLYTLRLSYHIHNTVRVLLDRRSFMKVFSLTDYMDVGRLRGGRACAASAPGGGPLLRRHFAILNSITMWSIKIIEDYWKLQYWKLWILLNLFNSVIIIYELYSIYLIYFFNKHLWIVVLRAY